MTLLVSYLGGIAAYNFVKWLGIWFNFQLKALSFLAQPAPAEAGVVGFLNVYVGAVPRTARNFRHVQGNAPYVGLRRAPLNDYVYNHKDNFLKNTDYLFFPEIFSFKISGFMLAYDLKSFKNIFINFFSYSLWLERYFY